MCVKLESQLKTLGIHIPTHARARTHTCSLSLPPPDTRAHAHTNTNTHRTHKHRGGEESYARVWKLSGPLSSYWTCAKLWLQSIAGLPSAASERRPCSRIPPTSSVRPIG